MSSPIKTESEPRPVCGTCNGQGCLSCNNTGEGKTTAEMRAEFRYEGVQQRANEKFFRERGFRFIGNGKWPLVESIQGGVK